MHKNFNSSSKPTNAGKKKFSLRTAFAAAVGSAAVATAALFSPVNGAPDQINVSMDKGLPAAPAEPGVIDAFGQSAMRTWTSQDFYRDRWMDMLWHEKRHMADPAKAQALVEFLKQFDGLRNEPLDRKANEVNKLVNEQIKYMTDWQQYHMGDYWADPIETVLSRKGDCEDFAILEKFVLRYLGVPESRMFIAGVNSQGQATAGVNHAVLLLNEGPDKGPASFFILSDIQPVLPTDNDVLERTWVMYEGGSRWKANFVLIDARNEHGYWKVPADTYSSTNRVSARAAPKSSLGVG